MDNQQVTDFEIGWLVGILDGEGCFSLAKCPRGYSPGIKFVNTNELIIEELVRLLKKLDMGPYVYNSYRTSNQQPAKRVEINGLLRVKKFIDFFLPYLVCKLDQATLLKEYIDLRLSKDKSEPHGNDEYSIYCLLRKR